MRPSERQIKTITTNSFYAFLLLINFSFFISLFSAFNLQISLIITLSLFPSDTSLRQKCVLNFSSGGGTIIRLNKPAQAKKKKRKLLKLLLKLPLKPIGPRKAGTE